MRRKPSKASFLDAICRDRPGLQVQAGAKTVCMRGHPGVFSEMSYALSRRFGWICVDAPKDANPLLL